jgi:hypothetical protein
MKITKKYLQKLIKEEISNQIVDVKESIEQDEWEIDVLDCAKGDICRLNDDVVGPDGSTFEIAVAAKKKDLGLVGSTASAVKTRAQKLAKISSLREARLETIIREEAAALLAESNAGAVIAMVLANKRLMKLLGPEAKSIILSVKDGGEGDRAAKLDLLLRGIVGGLYCPDGIPATDNKNRPRCNRTKLNPDFSKDDKNLMLTTLEKIKNFESEQAGDTRAHEMSLMHGMHGLEEGAIPGEISAEDLTAAITLAIDEVFQEHRPNREAAAEAYANIMESIDAIFRESYAASVRASKMMGAEAGFEDLDV